ncbi:MAG: outer membrane protein assembly factor BamA, partial [Planctomycetota bacterium]|nr:outer membrane protein assembly factor BamA [Planctomycetota bacterium]
CCLFMLFGTSQVALGQAGDGDDLSDRPISQVLIIGNERVSEQMIRNNIRTFVGDPFDPETVGRDVRRLSRLGEFKTLHSEAELLEDGSVKVLFFVTEQAIIAAVEVVGNRKINDSELRALIPVLPGGPRDDFLIGTGKRAIEDYYKRKGYFLTSVEIDASSLDDSNVLIYRIREGPRVKVKIVEFEGAESIRPKRLMKEIKTKPEIFMLRKGELSDEALIEDVASLDKFYKSRGYLDVRVDRRIDLSPGNREAKIVFLIQEGRQYRLGRVRARRLEDGGALKVFSTAQLEALLEIKSGDVFQEELLDKSVEAVREAYGIMGYLEVRDRNNIRVRDVRTSPDAVVDLIIEIREGSPSKVGTVQINGNFLTRDKVIRRQVRLEPGRPYNLLEFEKSQRAVRRTRLFNDVRFTVQDPDEVDGEYRDLLVEIKERNTGSLNFGFAVGSDSGLFGEFSYNQNNFDISDTPESFSELLQGRAFRGGGQRFSMTVRPGNEFFQYVVSLTEPNMFDTDYSLNVSGAFRSRIFDDYDEERISSTVRVGRTFGDIWSGSLGFQGQRVELTEIDSTAPTEVFRDQGPDTLLSTSINMTRSTIETFQRPGRGSRLELGYDYYGLGGDIEFQRLTANYTVLMTLTEDFLGRKSILRLNSRVGYIFDGRAPTYERFYLGGRTFRGFEFRTVSPKGIRNDTGLVGDDPVGGDWMVFFGAQYEIPLLSESMTGVIFVDSGTVFDDIGFDDYRVSIGAGIRLYIPAFGQLPIAFDFATPIKEEDGDETQVFSFTAELPF